jgi:hypothetical protein
MICNLMLHCGAAAVERPALSLVSTPRATSSWQPIPHEDLIHRVERLLPQHGLRVVNESHALTHDGSRYFGLLQVANGDPGTEYGRVLGIRNSHDKSFPAGVVAGTQVFVCDNLAFCGEITVTRKHTRYLMRDLPGKIERAVDELVVRWESHDRRVESYKARRVSDRMVHDLTIRALDAGAFPARQLPAVLHEWREPRHEAFRPRNLWSFFNAVTENQKGNLMMLPRRTEALHRVCDAAVGLN